MRLFEGRSYAGEKMIAIRRRLRFEGRACVLWLLGLALLASCQPQSVREEKALRRQLSHEMHHHSYASAIPLARKLLRMAPQDEKIWALLVQAQIGLHDFDAARVSLGDWRVAIRTPSGKPDELEGDILHAEGKPGAALQAWQSAHSLQPKNARVLAKIAALLQRQQRWSDAIEAWTRNLQIKDNATARINRAVCYRRLRMWDEAFHDFHHAQKLGAEEPDVQHWTQLFHNISKFLDIIKEFDARVTALRDDPGLLAERSLLMLRCGDPELALDDADQSGRLAPWAIQPRLFKALALIALGRGSEADALSVRLPLRLESLSPEFLETISRIDSAIAVERNNPEHYAARAWQLNEIGQPLLALADADTAVRLDPNSATGRVEQSYALTKLGRTQEAFSRIKEATELNPQLAPAWQYRGELEMARGDNLAAVESFTHALNQQVSSPALQKREECYRRLGLSARADEDHRTLLNLNTRNAP
jgi:tetratricopeptide (TPR) repeat protein